MVTNDDEDWLYRRGRYAESGAAGGQPPAPVSLPPTAQPAAQPAKAAVSSAPRPASAQPPRPPAAPPTAVPAAAGPKRPRRRHPVRTVVIVLALIVAYLVGVPLVAFNQASRVDATPEGTRPASVPGHLFVLAGSDQRDDLSLEEQQKMGTGSDAGKRSDVLMLLYVPPSGKAALISVPRDSYVNIPGKGKNKINAAYSFGGPKLLVATVEEAIGLRVDGYAEVGFGGFVAMVDAVGGVEMCPEKAVKDEASNLDIQAGCQRFDGLTALAYARMRHLDPLADLGRVNRQRELLSAIATEAATPMTVLWPPRYWAVSSAAAKSITLGKDVGILDVGALGTGVVRMGTGQGLTFTLPVSNANLRTSAGLAVAWDADKTADIFSSIARGDTANLERYAG